MVPLERDSAGVERRAERGAAARALGRLHSALLRRRRRAQAGQVRFFRAGGPLPLALVDSIAAARSASIRAHASHIDALVGAVPYSRCGALAEEISRNTHHRIAMHVFVIRHLKNKTGRRNRK